MSTNCKSTLPLLSLSTTHHVWIHYSVDQRTSNLDITLDDGYRQKCNEALHFAIGDEWVQAASDWMKKEYAHKYKLLNFESLKLLDISRSTVVHLLPLPLAEWGPDWKAIKERGYDGVYIHHDDLYEGESLPAGYGRWQTFAHNFDVDTLIIWRGAEIEELTNDWPPRTDVKKLETAAEDQRKAVGALLQSFDMLGIGSELRNLLVDEHLRLTPQAEEKKTKRGSLEIRREKNIIEVEQLRTYFPGYDEHYPVKPPGSAPWPKK